VSPRRGFTAAQVRAAERPLLDAGEPLMLRAAAALAAELRDLSPARMLVLVGAGDNGGDALYAAAELATEGVDVELVAAADRHHPEAGAAAVAAGARWVTDSALAERAAAADVVVDGILGTGSSPGLRGRARDVVAAVLPVLDADDRPRVVAVDLPSGIGADDGSVPDPVVPARRRDRHVRRREGRDAAGAGVALHRSRRARRPRARPLPPARAGGHRGVSRNTRRVRPAATS